MTNGNTKVEPLKTREELIEGLKDILVAEIKAHDAYVQDTMTFTNFVLVDKIDQIRKDEEKHIAILRHLLSVLEKEK